MESLQTIDFPDALARLQGMLGKEVAIAVNLGGCVFDCGFKARLERVMALPDGDGVLVMFERGQGIAIDPDELEAFVGRWSEGASTWLEFHIRGGIWLTLEP